MMRECPECGREVSDAAAACPGCGYPLAGAAYQAEVVRCVTSGKAVASLVCSLVGLGFCFFVGQILGIVFGYQARREIRESGGALTGEGMATAGIIVGWVGLAIDILFVGFSLLWFIVFAGAAAYSVG